jgi:hypothetical protein
MDLASALEAEARAQAACMLDRTSKRPTRHSAPSGSRSFSRAMMPDTEAVRAFLSQGHLEMAVEVATFAGNDIAPRPEPRDDRLPEPKPANCSACSAAAPGSARFSRRISGAAVWCAKPWRRPLRWQTLSLPSRHWARPLLIAGGPSLRDRWVTGAVEGRLMSAFAMTEPEAGSDVASMTTTARGRRSLRTQWDQDIHLQRGNRRLVHRLCGD